jgi:hypothetical protein
MIHHPIVLGGYVVAQHLARTPVVGAEGVVETTGRFGGCLVGMKVDSGGVHVLFHQDPEPKTHVPPRHDG